MSEINATEAHVEGTQFYRRSNSADILRIILVSMVVLILLLILALWFLIDSGAREAYKEARDVRKALIAVGTEYYGSMVSLYDPGSSNGLASGAEDKIADLSMCDGTIILYDWDDDSIGPLKFEYRTGLYEVVYTDTGSQNGLSAGLEGDFEVYYSLKLFNFELG